MHYSLIMQFAILLYSYGLEGVEIKMQVFLEQVYLFIVKFFRRLSRNLTLNIRL